jgi:hypothetical protein
MKSLEEIFNSKKITDSSKKLYTSNLIRLNNNEPITNFKFLENPEIIKSKLENSKPNTQRNYYIAICSVLSELKNDCPGANKEAKKFQKLYDSYYKTLIEFNTQLKDQTKMTPEENTNWISMNDINELFDSKKEILQVIKGKRKLTEEMYSELLDLVILGLYTLMPPRRNIDYIYMKIASGDEDPSFNYVDIKNGEFILNNYKTAGTYKTQRIKINPELLNIIKIYSKFIPDKLNNFFLQKFNGIPFTESNQLTKKLNEIFGKRVSSSMLRKIYLTDKYSDTIESMKQDAADMGTSTSVMTTNYIKNIPNIV